ncbi:MAG: glycosyltransferase family 4 protein [Bacteroidales bacterium]
MKIGFDAKRAFSNHTGLGNYSRYIIRLAAENCDCIDQVNLYTPSRNLDSLPRIETHNANIRIPNGWIYKRLRPLWRSFGVKNDINTDEIDIYQGLSGELPLGGWPKEVKSIVTIHDLIFLRYPEFYKWVDRSIYYYKFRAACRNATHIIAISECTKRDIMFYFNISPKKISVLYQGCNPIFREKITLSEIQDVRTKYNLPEKFLLNVGSIERRKNILQAVKALGLINNPPPLYIIGKETDYCNEIRKSIKELKLEDKVFFLKNIPTSDLPAIYQAASIFIYPSLYEGFGIPILEALCSATPVIAATGSCLEEAGGPNSIYVDPHDIEAMANAIENIINNPALSKRMSQEGIAYAQRFNDNLIAQQLNDLYKKVKRN